MNDHVVDLSYDLIRTALASEDWHHFDTPDGTVAVPFEGADFLVSIAGGEDEILVVTGLVDASGFTPEQIDDILETWHRRHRWPTCRREIDAEGSVSVVTEVAGFYPSGLSAGQVATQLRRAVGSTQALVARLRAEPV